MTYSYTTPLLVQQELQTTTSFNIDTVPSYETVERLIKEESEQLNSDTGRTWGSTSYTVDIDYDGYSDHILLEHSPILSITSFQYNRNVLGHQDGTDYVTKTEDTDFTVYEDQGRIDILTNNFRPQVGKKRFRITYTAGYNTIPLKVRKVTTKMVALRILDGLLNKDVFERNDGGSISVGSISIVEPENYGADKYKLLKEEIQNTKADLSKEGFGVWRYDG